MRAVFGRQTAAIGPATLGRSGVQRPRGAGSHELSSLGASGRLQRLPRAGVRGGALACNPSCVRMFSIAGCSRIAAMIFSSPPQHGQCSGSISNTRLSSLAQLRYRPVVCTARLGFGGLCFLRGRFRLLRNHQRAQLSVGPQHAMEAIQVQPRAWHQRRQPLHELQRRHDQMRGAVAPGCLELEQHLPGGVCLHKFVAQRGPEM